MLRPFCCSSIVAAILCVIAAGGLTSAAQAEPERINRLASKTEALTQREIDQIAAFSQYWIAELESGDAEAMNRAHRRLREPLRQPGITGIFRDEYGRAALPQLTQALAGSENDHVAVNLLQAAAYFESEQALNLMVNHADPLREARVAVRLWAAIGFERIIGSNRLEGRRVSRQVREMARAAQEEEHWHVLYRHFDALAAAPESASHQVQVLGVVLDRIEGNSKANPSMQAVQRGAALLLQQYMRMPASEQREFGEQAGRTFGRVFQVADAHWEVAQQDERAREWYLSAIRSTESLLKALDAQVRSTTPPNTDLGRAWEEGNRDTFRRDLERWQGVLNRQPYR